MNSQKHKGELWCMSRFSVNTDINLICFSGFYSAFCPFWNFVYGKILFICNFTENCSKVQNVPHTQKVIWVWNNVMVKHYLKDIIYLSWDCQRSTPILLQASEAKHCVTYGLTWGSACGRRKLACPTGGPETTNVDKVTEIMKSIIWRGHTSD